MRKLVTMIAVLLMAVAAIAAQCAGITKKGTQCKRQASPGSQYCWQHGGTTKAQREAGVTTDAEVAKARCKATTKAGTQCKRQASPGSQYCWQHSASNGATVGSTEPSTKPAGKAVPARQTPADRGQCDAITKGGKRCTRKAQPGGSKCWQHAK